MSFYIGNVMKPLQTVKQDQDSEDQGQGFYARAKSASDQPLKQSLSRLQQPSRGSIKLPALPLSQQFQKTWLTSSTDSAE